MPPELGKLTRLEWLVACANRLSGPIPPELGKLRALERVYLCSNRLEGSLPKEMGDLGKLVHLYLGGNRLSGEFPESMLSLTRLTELFWRRNNGLCAPRTEEFEEWLEGIPKSSQIYCEAEEMEWSQVETETADPGICWLTVAAPQDAAEGRLSHPRGAGRGGMAGARSQQMELPANIGPPGIRAVSCDRGR